MLSRGAFVFRGQRAIQLLSHRGSKGKAGTFYEPKEWLWERPAEPPTSDEATGWTQESRRTGLYAQKLGMTQDWDHWGVRTGITALHVPFCHVIQVKLEEQHGYNALQVGTGHKHPNQTTKPLREHYAKAGLLPKAVLGEFKVSRDALLPVGTELFASHFVPGQYVDVRARTIGKGFAGPMKRWGFKGGPASHGTSKAHRTHGSTGACQDPGRVFKGKKMAGRMGHKFRTTKNLQVFKVDNKLNIIFVAGAVPGAKGTFVRIFDAKNKKLPMIPPYPTYVPTEDEPEEVYAGMYIRRPYQEGMDKITEDDDPTWNLSVDEIRALFMEKRRKQLAALLEAGDISPDEYMGRLDPPAEDLFYGELLKRNADRMELTYRDLARKPVYLSDVATRS
mmetsp:Transcript_18732/g.47628  ORF Transcript_18732/g.47628 Transcript_18732/m.47628 type:complete len:392 (-) Transcript_18732:38-1213(-)